MSRDARVSFSFGHNAITKCYLQGNSTRFGTGATRNPVNTTTLGHRERTTWWREVSHPQHLNGLVPEPIQRSTGSIPGWVITVTDRKTPWREVSHPHHLKAVILNQFSGNSGSIPGWVIVCLIHYDDYRVLTNAKYLTRIGRTQWREHSTIVLTLRPDYNSQIQDRKDPVARGLASATSTPHSFAGQLSGALVRFQAGSWGYKGVFFFFKIPPRLKCDLMSHSESIVLKPEPSRLAVPAGWHYIHD
ncbi:hypothetical protein B0H16DRAFT_1476782 [Mycena metata]|uniref:Uncharacterized protein n=1 Tax=Mycena metata TaxID=1033252 RepID=A0AAD7HBJ3_9AGAR|nr:hypothetical protein B0H16DRAFT_1476782 [Mycena metata]